jgi:guanine deaminase
VTCLEDRIGNFVVGKEFDALLVQTGQKSVEEMTTVAKKGVDEYEASLFEEVEDRFPAMDFNPSMFIEPEDSLEKVFEKFLFSVGPVALEETSVGRR